MKNNLFICWHLGLGDAIVCAPIVRHYAGEHELVVIPVKYHNVASVTYLFRDLENVAIRPVEDDREMLMFKDQVWKKQLVLTLGGMNIDAGFDIRVWDQEFYRQAGLPFDLRWDAWQCKRDEAAEEKVCASGDGLGYSRNSDRWRVFVHEDQSRGMAINFKQWGKIPEAAFMLPEDETGVRVIRPSQITPILFHWRAVIEACDEIHAISSSFAHFIDSINLPKNPKKYLHAYARKEPLATFRNWEILT